MKNVSWDSRCRGRGSNRVPLHQPVRTWYERSVRKSGLLSWHFAIVLSEQTCGLSHATPSLRRNKTNFFIRSVVNNFNIGRAVPVWYLGVPYV
jgi:hypothetical protein